MNPVTFNCTVLRDGHQSLAATRMKTEDMLPVAPILDSMASAPWKPGAAPLSTPDCAF